jgi:hypothetical protein
MPAPTPPKIAPSNAGERRAILKVDGPIVDEESSQAAVDREVIEYLGYERTDWEDGRWYIMGIAKRGGLGDPRYVAVFDRQLMAPGLSYSLCGEDGSSICYVEE